VASIPELQLEILAVLEDRFGQKTRTLMRMMQFGDLLTYAGGARLVLAQARWRGYGSAVRHFSGS